MLLLLLVAFFCTNLLSLVYLAMIAVGMAAPANARGLTWRFGVLPLLAIILVEQYSLYIGPPPPWDQGQPREMDHHTHEAEKPSVKASLDADLFSQGCDMVSIKLQACGTSGDVHSCFTCNLLLRPGAWQVTLCGKPPSYFV